MCVCVFLRSLYTTSHTARLLAPQLTTLLARRTHRCAPAAPSQRLHRLPATRRPSLTTWPISYINKRSFTAPRLKLRSAPLPSDAVHRFPCGAVLLRAEPHCVYDRALSRGPFCQQQLERGAQGLDSGMALAIEVQRPDVNQRLTVDVAPFRIMPRGCHTTLIPSFPTVRRWTSRLDRRSAVPLPYTLLHLTSGSDVTAPVVPYSLKPYSSSPSPPPPPPP